MRKGVLYDKLCLTYACALTKIDYGMLFLPNLIQVTPNYADYDKMVLKCSVNCNNDTKWIAPIDENTSDENYPMATDYFTDNHKRQ